MTKVYFVRHAEPNYNNHDDMSRELSAKGMIDRELVTRFLSDKNIVIGSHGTALRTIINYYDKSFGYEEFEKIRTVMPWIVEFVFQNDECVSMEYIDQFP